MENGPIANAVTTSDDLLINCTATKHVRDVIAALGRTEDIKFSPNNRRLAVTSFLRNKIVVFDVCITRSLSSKTISITDVSEFASDHLRQPHGVDFIDDETIIVANRAGDATIFELPAVGSGSNCVEPLGIIRADHIVHSPGAVSISRKDKNLYETLICNNFTNKITKHLVEAGSDYSVTSNEILLTKRLNLPDGVSVKGEWIAISNHNAHTVFLYKNTELLHEFSDPDGILRGMYHPHGLRFSSDGRFILVADSAAPYVHIYGKDKSGWAGVRNPLKSIRVLTDENFLRGQESPHDGGPKGIDIDNSSSILVATCKVQPLAFFDVAGLLERIYL